MHTSRHLELDKEDPHFGMLILHTEVVLPVYNLTNTILGITK